MPVSISSLPSSRIPRAVVPDLIAGAAVAIVAVVALALLPGGTSAAPASVLVTGLVYCSVAAVVALTWPEGRPAFGWPNRVTLLRAALAAVLAGPLVVPSSLGAQGWALASIAGVALVLDGVDGWLARRLDRASRFGARFDMEIDALLLLVLSAAAWLAGKAGVWVLAIGLMRYVFVAAGWLWPKLTAELRPSEWRKTVCVIQGIVLAVALVPAVPAAGSVPALAVALMMLVLSFARDTLYLIRRSSQARSP
jgi:phosphatidylglycerophosphate synthase